VQWNKRINELEGMGIRLVMVSIGKPEKGQELVSHLELGDDRGSNYLFVDPENDLYDALDLNRGVQRTFFHPGTPFAMLDRFTQKDGTKDLGNVLSKWSKAIYIPPKQEQAFLQGGSFVFDGSKTLFSHYDPSTAAHAKIDRVIDISINAIKKREGTLTW